MTPEEFTIARGKLGWTDERLGSELQVSQKVVQRWTDGTLRIPAREAKWIAWHAAVAERDGALVAAGIPECEWVKAWEAEPIPERARDVESSYERLNAHADQCPRCQQRESFIRERFPAMPEVPTGASGFAFWTNFLNRFPDWTHPVFTGAAILTIIVGIRMLIVVPRGASPKMLLAIPLAAALGAVGGLAYSALRPFIRAGGGWKSLAHVLVLLTYATAGFALLDFGTRFESGLPMSGSIGLWSFIVVAAIVVVLWRLSLKRGA